MLNVISLKEAINIAQNNSKNIIPQFEEIEINECLNRIIYEDIYANENVPNFNRSTVDGFAVNAKDTFGSSENFPAEFNIIGEIKMGESTSLSLNDGECAKISTGGMLPKGANAVIMVEYTQTELDTICLCYKSISPNDNVIKIGDDTFKGVLVIKKGTVLSSNHIGILVTLGIYNVKVYKKIKIGIISTGDELVDRSNNLPLGKIRNSNTYILFSLCKKYNAEPVSYGHFNDDYEKIRDTIKLSILDNDITLISGGSSAGEKDMTVNIADELGNVLIHGLAIKPGKPTIFANCNNKPFFGLPGNPLAAFFVFEQLVKPTIEAVYTTKFTNNYIFANITENISSNHGREEFVCVKINNNDTVTPVISKSGIISTLIQSDGYICIDRNTEGIKKDTTVKVYLW